MSAYINIPPSSSGSTTWDQTIGPLGADAATVTFTNLDGENDGGYEIECFILNASAATCQYTLQPNGVTANQNTARLNHDATTASAVTSADLRVASGSANSNHFVVVRMNSKTGRRRGVISESTNLNTAQMGDLNSCQWNDTATAITSIIVNASVAAGLGAGSRFSLRKMKNPLL